MINYIDDFVGAKSFQCLCDLLHRLGLTLSDKKLVSPTTQATCLGVNINITSGTISIPPEKLEQIMHTVKLWLTKTCCTTRELQSLLGQLLYVHQCVRPAHIFLNRMLLRHNYEKSVINVTQGFRRDLRWFDTISQKIQQSIHVLSQEC